MCCEPCCGCGCGAPTGEGCCGCGCGDPTDEGCGGWGPPIGAVVGMNVGVAGRTGPCVTMLAKTPPRPRIRRVVCVWLDCNDRAVLATFADGTVTATASCTEPVQGAGPDCCRLRREPPMIVTVTEVNGTLSTAAMSIAYVTLPADAINVATVMPITTSV